MLLVRERVVRLGEGGRVVAIHAPAEHAPGERPAFIFVNAGVLPRVGPRRLHVRLARRLAAAGFDSVRLDLGGLGDSEPRREATSTLEGAVGDIRDAADWLAAHRGARRFVLFGLCSGADFALRAASRDERVAGAVLLDGPAYRTPGFLARHYAARLLRARSWRGLLSRALRLVRRGLLGAGAAGAVEEDDPRRKFPPRSEMRATIAALAARGAHLLWVYTGGMAMTFNHAGQLAAMFPEAAAAPTVRLRHVPDADHTFTLRAHQDRLIEDVLAFARESFGAAAAPPPPLEARAITHQVVRGPRKSLEVSGEIEPWKR